MMSGTGSLGLGSLVLIVLIVLAVTLVRYVTSRGVLKGAS
jgi:phosphate transport system permease protein